MIDYKKYFIKERDWCSYFPESIRNISIKECCFRHDVDCGSRGSYNLLLHQINFNKCLREKGISLFIRIFIISGVSIFCLLASPVYLTKKAIYRLIKYKDIYK